MAKKLEVEDITEVEGDDTPPSATLDLGLVVATTLCLVIGIGLAWWQLKEQYGAGPLGP